MEGVLMTDDPITCPNCSLLGEMRVRGEEGEVECPGCAWEFQVEAEGDVLDDGGLDAEGPFGMDAEEAEPEADGWRQVECPHCVRRWPVEPGVDLLACPRCRHSIRVEDGEVLEPEEDLWEEYDPPDDEDCVEDQYPCPGCNAGAYGGGSYYVPLARGWLACEDCGWEFYDPVQYAQWVERMHERYGMWGRPLRDRVIVAADGTGDFPDLEAALAHTPDGGTLLIRPGVYAGPVRIPYRTITLQGEGPDNSNDLLSGMCVQGGTVVLRGITLRQPLVVEQAVVRAEGCYFEGEDGPAVSVVGHRCRVRLRDCRLSDSREEGLHVSGGAVVRLFGCRLEGNAAGGVRVDPGAWVRLQDCEICRNGGRGIEARPSSAVFLRRCTVAENAGPGVAVRGGRAVLSRSDIRGQQGCGVLLGPRARAVLLRCRIRDGRADGVRLKERARAFFQDCVCSGNESTGLVAGPGSRSALQRCELQGNGAFGGRLSATARASLRDCDSAANRRGGWDVQPGGLISVRSRRALSDPGDPALPAPPG
jgi:hypothetical protein